jgi:hypothetical protein
MVKAPALSLAWLLVKLGTLVLLSMNATEIVVIAYQRF